MLHFYGCAKIINSQAAQRVWNNLAEERKLQGS